ncbi:MAG: cytochrome c3 family protein [Planctomycetia bacterium]
MNDALFPKWLNRFRATALAAVLFLPAYAMTLIAFGAAPMTTDVGYQPTQPVPFSHALHAGQLGMDCRYCHNTVDKAAHAAVPPTETCMNCHSLIKTKSAVLTPVRESWATDKPVDWIKVHDLPDYVYFNHSAHVTRGVSCVSCHGRIDKAEKVGTVKTLSMGWCLECHRNPEPNLRDRELVTKLDWKPEGDPAEYGAKIRKQYDINPSTDCSTCHR